ncbi:hypothetical protein [Flavobacterium sp. SM2513]|uniref:hypothetical protein n=1 Tax=Flavobacterium sp. SM2513 TaxID=3424766 RepID=UPI003D800174
MKAENKVFVKSAVMTGLLYAAIMAGFEYSQGEDFKIMKFAFLALFFGLSMGLLSRYNYKKGLRKADKDGSKPISK